jgi:hypothetical protein
MIGSRMAAASSGGMIRASSGVEIMPTPEKPPFDRPSMITPGTAHR